MTFFSVKRLSKIWAEFFSLGTENMESQFVTCHLLLPSNLTLKSTQ